MATGWQVAEADVLVPLMKAIWDGRCHGSPGQPEEDWPRAMAFEAVQNVAEWAAKKEAAACEA
jgi:hypothetical protein